MDTRPEMRATHVRENLTQLRRLGPTVEAAVRGRCKAEDLARIETSSRSTWLPVELDVALTEALCATLSERGCREWSREALRSTLETPLFRPMLSTGVKLFGLRPGKLVNWSLRGWDAIYRHCGTLTGVAHGENALQVTHRGLPREIRSRAYLVGVAGAFEALVDVCKRRGEVDLRWDPGADSCLYEIRWD